MTSLPSCVSSGKAAVRRKMRWRRT